MSPVDSNVTLAKLLFALPSSDTSDKLLFFMIEQDYNNSNVVFHYSKNNHQKANEVITTLLLFVEGVFGKAVAQEWIMDEAWTLVENYQVARLDPKDGL